MGDPMSLIKMPAEWRGKPGPIMLVIYGPQIGGKRCRTLRNLPAVCFERMSPMDRKATVRCVELDEALASVNLFRCERVIITLACELSETPGGKPTISPDVFMSIGGMAILFRVLFYPFEEDDSYNSGKIWTVRKNCIDILRELCSTARGFTQMLADDQGFLVKCFWLMENEITVESAILLVEEILQVRGKNVFDLREVKNITTLISNFCRKELLLFCRVLAILASSENEEPVLITTCDTVSRRAEKHAIGASNTEIIRSIPNILQELMKILFYESDSGFLVFEKIDPRMIIRNFLDGTEREGDISFARTLLYEHGLLDEGEEFDVDDEAYVAGYVPSLPEPEIIPFVNHVQILRVLGALCNGINRDEVQTILGDLGLVEILSHIFDMLDWSSGKDKDPLIHDDGCACEPQLAIKHHFLRLLYYFCEGDSCNNRNKELLLEPLVPRLPYHEGFEPDTGLILKIAKLLIREPADSVHRYWLASCVTAFLRGSKVRAQEAVGATGLMEHLIEEIFKDLQGLSFSPATSLQVKLDLLGELIKYNEPLLSKLGGLLVGEKFHRFADGLVTNLLDSNVFIRSILLSVNSCNPSLQDATRTNSLKDEHVHSGIKIGSRSHRKSHKYWHPFEDFLINNEYRLLRDLMTALPVAEANTGNICVINAALCLFILAKRRGTPPATYLQKFLSNQCLKSGRGEDILHNFRLLLNIWRNYYSRAGNPSTLQYTTNIPFEDWSRMVNFFFDE